MEREQSYPGPGWSLGDIWAAVMRKWVTALVLFAVTVVAAGVLGALWPKSYEGRAVIAVSPLAGNPTRDIEVNIDTEAVIVTSRRVITAAASELGVNAADLQDRTSVAIPTDSNALQVTVTAGSPKAAADEANAVATAYLGYRAKQAEALVRRYVKEGIDTQIDSLLSGLPADASSGERGMVQRRVVALREKKSQIIASAPGPGDVVSRATAPTSPSSPGLPIFLGAGVILGLLVGGAAGLLHDRFDPRVRSARLLGRHVPCRVLESGSRSPSHLWEYVVFSLKAVRREAGTRVDAPTVILSTESALASDFVKEVRRAGTSESTGPVVVVPQPGAMGVAQGVATNAADSVFVLLCRNSDRFPAVNELVESLEEWNREPSLVLMLDAEPKPARQREPKPAKAKPAKAKDSTPQKSPQQGLVPAKVNGPSNGAGNGAGNGTLAAKSSVPDSGSVKSAGNGNGVSNGTGSGVAAGNGNGNGQRPQVGGQTHQPFSRPDKQGRQ